jgi:hypothetical protein
MCYFRRRRWHSITNGNDLRERVESNVLFVYKLKINKYSSGAHYELHKRQHDHGWISGRAVLASVSPEGAGFRVKSFKNVRFTFR